MSGQRRISPLTLRIFAVNIGALLLLVLGLLYTGNFERWLIDLELQSASSESAYIATLFSQNGVRKTEDGVPVLADDLVRTVSRSLILRHNVRVIVFDRTGALLVDSHQLFGSGGLVEMVPLSVPGGMEQDADQSNDMLMAILNWIPIRLSLPVFPTRFVRGLRDYPGIMAALNGRENKKIWRDEEARIMLSVARPVERFNDVLGAVLVLRSSDEIRHAMHHIQSVVLMAFLFALAITVLLSLYLAETIVRPIARLADATKNVQRSRMLKDTLPDLSWRRDEIGDLSISFRNMTFALSDRIDSISKFAADVAHEIKNPLASVQSAVETLPNIKDPEKQAVLLSVIDSDVKRMTRLVTDISNASRLDSELARTEKISVDMLTMLQEIVAVESLRLTDPHQIVLELEDKKRLPVAGNEQQLRQVFHNLIENALSFSPPEKFVTVRARLDGDKVMATVENEGPPIPESKMTAIFERFYSERPKVETFGAHSGLGLSICKQIVKAHQGEIFARNLKDALGEHSGVCFTVILPAGAGIK